MNPRRSLEDVSILFLVPHTPQSVGYESGEEFLSIATYHDHYCREASDRGATVELSYISNEPTPEIDSDYHVTTMPVTIGSTFGHEVSMSLCRRLTDISTDIVHIQGYNQLNVVPLLWCLAFSDTRVIIQNHGGALDLDRLSHKLWYHFLSQHIPRIVETVFSVNTVELENLKRIGVSPERLKHIPNAVDTNKFSPIESAKSRSELGLSNDLQYLLFVGKITKNKGVTYLVEALDQLPKNVHLLLVYSSEDADERKKVDQRIDERDLIDRIHFIGPVDHDRLPVYYNAADIAVFPSVNEGFGVVTLEAMGCGTPVVGTTEHLSGGHLTHCKNALVAEAGSSDDLQRNISRLLSDESLYRKISKTAMKTVQDQYSWDRVGETLSEVYQGRDQ